MKYEIRYLFFYLFNSIQKTNLLIRRDVVSFEYYYKDTTWRVVNYPGWYISFYYIFLSNLVFCHFGIIWFVSFYIILYFSFLLYILDYRNFLLLFFHLFYFGLLLYYPIYLLYFLYIFSIFYIHPIF